MKEHVVLCVKGSGKPCIGRNVCDGDNNDVQRGQLG